MRWMPSSWRTRRWRAWRAACRPWMPCCATWRVTRRARPRSASPSPARTGSSSGGVTTCRRWSARTCCSSVTTSRTLAYSATVATHSATSRARPRMRSAACPPPSPATCPWPTPTHTCLPTWAHSMTIAAAASTATPWCAWPTAARVACARCGQATWWTQWRGLRVYAVWWRLRPRMPRPSLCIWATGSASRRGTQCARAAASGPSPQTWVRRWSSLATRFSRSFSTPTMSWWLVMSSASV
mmetsp:Transcript_12885/g.41163  ORF Transcript_12885/g.41163 Transcript_12885/m.41163 type:complete len:241 (-) Transcript_12885:162-884(-)